MPAEVGGVRGGAVGGVRGGAVGGARGGAVGGARGGAVGGARQSPQRYSLSFLFQGHTPLHQGSVELELVVQPGEVISVHPGTVQVNHHQGTSQATPTSIVLDSMFSDHTATFKVQCVKLYQIGGRGRERVGEGGREGDRGKLT